MPLRGDSFAAQRAAGPGFRWLHVHPDYLVTSLSQDVIRLALRWREGVLPGPGGVQDQAAWTISAIETVTGTWARMEAAALAKAKEEK